VSLGFSPFGLLNLILGALKMSQMLRILKIVRDSILLFFALLFLLFCIKVYLMFYQSIQSEKEFRQNMMKDCLNVGISKEECERLALDTWAL
jgi:hypothetical protein